MTAHSHANTNAYATLGKDSEHHKIKEKHKTTDNDKKQNDKETREKYSSF